MSIEHNEDHGILRYWNQNTMSNLLCFENISMGDEYHEDYQDLENDDPGTFSETDSESSIESEHMF